MANTETTGDKKFRRMLNILALSRSAGRPLTKKDFIANDPEGYPPEIQAASNESTFNRDMKSLRDLGYEFTKSKRKEDKHSYFQLTKESAKVGEIIFTQRELSILYTAVEPLAYDKNYASSNELKALLRKIKGVNTQNKTTAIEDTVPYRAKQALLSRQTIDIEYRNAENEKSKRTVATYALFTHSGVDYLVGHDNLSDSVRIFRLSRIDTLAVSQAKSSYKIPSDFDKSMYPLLSFNLGGTQSTEIKIAIPANQSFRMEALTKGQGTYSYNAKTQCNIWTVKCSDITAAAKWLIVNGTTHAIPLAPPELITEYRTLITKSEELHA